MAKDDHRAASSQVPLEPQPPVLVSLLAGINAARRQMSLYGLDHPNTEQSAAELAATIAEFCDAFGRSTLVFAKTTTLINEHSYRPSQDSQEFFRRLCDRGVMALTIVSSPPKEQIKPFIGFLNAEADEIREQGGASASLRKRQVSLIVATDAVYTSGDGDEEEDAPKSAANPKEMDRALGAAINWLLKQDEEEEATPRLPITEILSTPDEAAKLIREAVTKLHASRRKDTRGEIASEVVHDLKDLASDEKEKWDNATPQIRKAISKLPRDMRPEVAGFTEDVPDEDDISSKRRSAAADAVDIEAQIADVLADSLVPGAEDTLPSPAAFESLFGASPCGLLSNWRRELQPGVVMGSSGRTLQTLMVQETRAFEHERIARALAGLLPRAVEMKDFASARMIAGALVRETQRGEPQDWRAMNARMVLRSIDKSVLKQVAENGISSNDPTLRHSTGELIQALPDLALQMIGSVGSRDLGDLSVCVIRGVVGCGSAAVGPLGRLVAEGKDAAKDLALEALIGMNTSASIREIGNVLPGNGEAFVIRGLGKLGAVKHPDVVDMAVELLNSSSRGVRCAALRTLSELAVPTSAPAIMRSTAKRGLSNEDIEERILALEALARMDSGEAMDFLQKASTRRPLLGKKQYESIRLAAEQLLAGKHQQTASGQRAA